MGTETWIISLPLSDSILYLKIIHPPNFREEPLFLLLFLLYPLYRLYIFLQQIREFFVAWEARGEGYEPQAVVCVASSGDFFGEDGPDFFDGAAVSERGSFCHIAVEAGVHVSVGVELFPDAVASVFVLPEEEDVSVFEVGYEGAVVEAFFVVVHPKVRLPVGVVGVEGRFVAAGVGGVPGDDAVVDEADFCVFPFQADFCAGFKAGKAVLAFFFEDLDAVFEFPSFGHEGFDEAEEAPHFIELIGPFPLELVEGGNVKARERVLKVFVEAVEDGVSGVAEDGHGHGFGHFAFCFFIPWRKRNAADALPEEYRAFPVVDELREGFDAHAVFTIAGEAGDFALAVFEAFYVAVDFLDEGEEILVEFHEERFSEAVLCDVPCHFRVEGGRRRCAGSVVEVLGPDVRLGTPVAQRPHMLHAKSQSRIGRAGEFVQYVQHHGRFVADGVEAEQHFRIDAKRPFELSGNMDIALHEIEGECLDFLDELIPHFLPALLFHVARIDFEDPVPRAACAFDGHNVVARDEREVLPGKEEDVLLPFGEDVRLLGFPLLPRKRHDVEAVHGEAEARRRFEAEEYILILRQGKGGREMARQPVRVYREAPGGNDPFLLCFKREGEWQFRSCNHRASAPRL